MNNNGPTEDDFFRQINSLSSEEFLIMLTYDFERHANSIKGWAMVLSKGYNEKVIEQVIQSLNWNADQMKHLIDQTRGYLNKNKKEDS